MSDWLIDRIRSEARRLLELAALDPQLRADLRALANEILERSSEVTDEPSEKGDQAGTGPEEILHELTLGQSRALSQAGASSLAQQPRRPGADSDWGLIEARCRRKAEAARWVAESERRAREGTASPSSGGHLDAEIAVWAQSLADSFYFASAKNSSNKGGISLLDDVAGCFEAVAESLALAEEPRQQGKGRERVLRFVAEAQSALRRALQRLDIQDDVDQGSVYEWLRATAARERVYLNKHMRADDLAEPSEWPSLLARIEQARPGHRKTPMEASQLELIRHHRTLILEEKGTGQDWPAIIAAVDALISGGMQTSSRDLRELLLPIIDGVPDRDDLPRAFERVIREIDRFLATRPQPSSVLPVTEPAAEVLQVARLLSGRSIVLIGGDRRHDSQEALRKAFGLESVIWIATKEHQSVYSFEPQIARPEVVLVLLAIRWSSHSFGEVRHLCESHGKPLVRLPGGYSPNQVALQILAQCSEQLGAGDLLPAPDSA
jgi:hypothetical protein